MTTHASKFLDELTKATRLVEQVVMQRITFPEFEREYENYYYAAALDGHEGSIPRELGTRIDCAIHLHRAVQGILDRTYHDADSIKSDVLRNSGRITPAEAEMQLQRLSMHHDISGILRELGST